MKYAIAIQSSYKYKKMFVAFFNLNNKVGNFFLNQNLRNFISINL